MIASALLNTHTASPDSRNRAQSDWGFLSLAKRVFSWMTAHPVLVSVVLGLLLLLLGTESANAQGVGSAGLFTVPASDKSKTMIIDRLFGGLTGGGSDPLVALMALFNQAALFLGGIIVAYTLIVGTMVTAHDGEMLGKQWSSLWVPIRTLIGTAFCVPAISGGYCIAQAIILWAALQGVGLADSLTSKFVDTMTNFQTYSAISASADIKNVVSQMFVNLSCSEAIKAQQGENLGSTQATLGQTTTDPSFVKGTLPDISAYPGSPTYGSVISGQPPVNYIFFPSHEDNMVGACGSMTLFSGALTQMNAQAGSGSSSLNGLAGTGMSDGANLFNSSAIYTDVFTAQKGALDILVAAVDQAAVKYVAGNSANSLVVADLNAASNAWAQSSSTAASNSAAANKNQQLVQAIKSDGWLMLGAWYMSIARAQQDVDSAASVVPEVNGVQVPLENGERAHWYNHIFGGGSQDSMVGTTLSAETIKKIVNAKTVGAISTSASATDAAVQESGVGAKIARYFSEKIMLPNTGSSSDDSTQNPVIAAQQLGDAMVIGSTAAMLVAAGVDQTMKASALGTTFGGLTNIIINLAFAVGMAIMTAGLTLAYYIPMVPFFLWIGAALAWLIMLLEAMIAAPLWMVAHINPEGQGFMGGARQGYSLLLGLVLRPSLMVIGFAAATAIMVPMGSLLNSIFFGAFLSGIQPSWFGLVSFVAGLVLYTIILQQIITKVFGLIHEIPEHSMSWFGGSGGGRLAQHAESMSGSARGMGQAVATGMAFQAIRGAANQNREARQRNEQTGNELAPAAAEQQQANDEMRASSGALSAAQGEATQAATEHQNAISQHGAGSAQAASAAAKSQLAQNNLTRAEGADQRAQGKASAANKGFQSAIGAARAAGVSESKIGAAQGQSQAMSALSSAESGHAAANTENISAQSEHSFAQQNLSAATGKMASANSAVSSAEQSLAAATKSGDSGRISAATEQLSSAKNSQKNASNDIQAARNTASTTGPRAEESKSALASAQDTWQNAIKDAAQAGGPAAEAAAVSRDRRANV